MAYPQPSGYHLVHCSQLIQAAVLSGCYEDSSEVPGPPRVQYYSIADLSKKQTFILGLLHSQIGTPVVETSWLLPEWMLNSISQRVLRNLLHCLGRQKQVHQHGLTFDSSVPNCTEQASQAVPTVGHFCSPPPPYLEDCVQKYLLLNRGTALQYLCQLRYFINCLNISPNSAKSYA